TNKQTDVPGGHFSLIVEELQETTPAELAAYESLAEAGRLTLKPSWTAVVEQLESAGTQWRKLRRRDELAEAEYLIAAVQYLHNSRWQDAVVHARNAHRLYSQLGNLDARDDAAILLAGALQEAAAGLTATASAGKSRRWLDESEQLLQEARDSTTKRSRS